jgi:hypothetical protein
VNFEIQNGNGQLESQNKIEMRWSGIEGWCCRQGGPKNLQSQRNQKAKEIKQKNKNKYNKKYNNNELINN